MSGGPLFTLHSVIKQQGAHAASGAGVPAHEFRFKVVASPVKDAWGTPKRASPSVQWGNHSSSVNDVTGIPNTGIISLR